MHSIFLWKLVNSFHEAVGLNSSIHPIEINAHFHNSLSVNDTSAIFSVQEKSKLFLPCITQSLQLNPNTVIKTIFQMYSWLNLLSVPKVVT